MSFLLRAPIRQSTPAVSLLNPELSNGGQGALVADWSVGATGTPSTVDAYPVPMYPAPAIPAAIGAAGSYYCQVNSGSESSNFANLSFYVKSTLRTDGAAYTLCRIDLGTSSAFTDRALASFTVPADDEWHAIVLPTKIWGTSGAFTLGTTAFTHVRIVDAGAASGLTLTSVPNAGDLSGTLTAAFGGTSGMYPVRFSTYQIVNAKLLNGSTTIEWDDQLTAAATTAIVYTTTRFQQLASDRTVFGPVYRNSFAVPFALVTLDDACTDQFTARQALSTTFVGQSGVTIPAGIPQSALSICLAFGLKANCFINTKYLDAQYFLSTAQLLELQNVYGWNIGIQSHNNPANSVNAGARMLGPYGYWQKDLVYGSIASVDTVADTITTASAHRIVYTTTLAGPQGFPIVFYGSGLPAPLQIGVTYWARNTSTTAFTLHPTELDSCQGTNKINLTTTGTIGNFDYRYAGATRDKTALVADFDQGQRVMQDAGFTGWRHYAFNQGAFDPIIEKECVRRINNDTMRLIRATLGSSGRASSSFIPRVSTRLVSAGIGYTGDVSANTTIGGWLTIPVAIATESVSTTEIRECVKAVVNIGGVLANFHHFFSSSATLTQFCTYCDEIKLRVDQGILATGTVEDLYQRNQVTP